MKAKWVFAMGLGAVAMAGIVGCGEEPPPPGDTAGDLVVDWNQSTGVGGAGGDGGMGGMGGMGGSSTTTTSSGPPTVQSVCEAGCHKVEILSEQIGCNPTPNCVQDCVDYGLSVGTCQNAYITLMDCAGKQMSDQTCYCSQTDGILACQLCPQENNNFSACLEGF